MILFIFWEQLVERDDANRTVNLLFRNQRLYHLRHNRCPTLKSFVIPKVRRKLILSLPIPIP